MRPFDNMFSTTFYATMVKNIIQKTAEYTREFEPNCDRLSIKLEAMTEEIFDKTRQAGDRVPTEFNCLIHSDLWTNNIMFNNLLPSASNVLLIDFQMVYAGSPVLDLCYSLFSSSDVSMRDQDFDSLFHYYHEQLSLALTKLGYKNEIPTLNTLHDQMVKRGVYGVPLGIFGTIGRYYGDFFNGQVYGTYLNMTVYRVMDELIANFTSRYSVSEVKSKNIFY